MPGERTQEQKQKTEYGIVKEARMSKGMIPKRFRKGFLFHGAEL